MTRRLPWLLLPLVAFLADWTSKAWVQASLLPGIPMVLWRDHLNFTLSYNPGAIFGFMGDLPPWVRATLFTLAALAALGYFGWEFLRDGVPTTARVALGLILGGIVGNSVDRFRHGHVVDFIDVVIRGWHYWTFNVADSFIVCGAILYGIVLLKHPHPK